MEQQGEEFPFGLGQLVESRSNIKGFRGAWFRSEIKIIQIRKGEIWCAMHYIDFPDEKTNFMKAYQHDLSGKKKRVLMVRPSFPLIFMGFAESVIKDAAGPVVVVNDGWWVGDLVDWFTDGCFWTARIAAVISKDIVQIELPSAPFGEGGSYEAAVKDIRPSLEWSMDQFWTVPSEKATEDVQVHPHALKAPTMDAPSDNFSSYFESFRPLDTRHIFIAKQETVRIPLLQDLNETSDGGGESQLKKKVIGSEFERPNARDADRFSVRATQHAFTVSETITVRAGVQDTAMASLNVHKDEAAWFSGQNPRPSHLPDTDFAASKPPPSQFHQLPQFSLGSSSCQPPADPKQSHLIGQTEAPTKADQQLNAVESARKADNEQNASSKNDAFSALRVMGDEFKIALSEEKELDLSDERISSSIVALEEQISRIAWLKGVMRLGLKGWSKERKKRKWVFCDNTEGDTKPDEINA